MIFDSKLSWDIESRRERICDAMDESELKYTGGSSVPTIKSVSDTYVVMCRDPASGVQPLHSPGYPFLVQRTMEQNEFFLRTNLHILHLHFQLQRNNRALQNFIVVWHSEGAGCVNIERLPDMIY